MTRLHTTLLRLLDSSIRCTQLISSPSLNLTNTIIRNTTMAPTDPHQGGRLEDMAAEGTSIPGDAGKQRLVGFSNSINHLYMEAYASPDPLSPSSRSEGSWP